MRSGCFYRLGKCTLLSIKSLFWKHTFQQHSAHFAMPTHHPRVHALRVSKTNPEGSTKSFTKRTRKQKITLLEAHKNTLLQKIVQLRTVVVLRKFQNQELYIGMLASNAAAAEHEAGRRRRNWRFTTGRLFVVLLEATHGLDFAFEIS